MFKKSGSRNQRSKGIRMKHVLQICLLLGVCFWLIYQVKRSHDKRKEFDEKDSKASVKAQIDDVIIKFGRKDLPHVQEVSTNHKHEEEEEEENGVEVEEEEKHHEEQDGKAKRVEEGEQEGISKHEDEEQEVGSKHEEDEQEEASKHEEEERDEASKHEEEEEEQEEVREDEGSKHDDDEEQEAEIKDEEAEDGGRGGGDDEVDGNELERADGEAVHEEEFMDEEKEREAEGDDKENEEKENEEKEREGEEESNNSENEHNHDEGDRNVHEAREEHYKADDASSAVSHDTHSEADKLDVENSDDNSMMNVLEQETKANTTEETNGGENKSELKVDDGKNSESGSSLNATYAKENDHETGSSNSEYISLPNTTHTTEFVDQTSNDSTEVSKETGNKPGEVNNAEMPGSLQNGTSAQHTTEDGKVTEETYQQKANETISYPDSNTANSNQIENVDLATRDSSNSSTNAESGMSEDIAKINATARGDDFGSSVTKEITDSTQNEKSEGDNESNGTDESNNTSSNETVDGAQQDPIDTSDNTLPQEEKDARVDLSTLPDITTEGSKHEDAAAE